MHKNLRRYRKSTSPEIFFLHSTRFFSVIYINCAFTEIKTQLIIKIISADVDLSYFTEMSISSLGKLQGNATLPGELCTVTNVHRRAQVLEANAGSMVKKKDLRLGKGP